MVMEIMVTATMVTVMAMVTAMVIQLNDNKIRLKYKK